MSGKGWITLLSLMAGVPLAAWGLTHGAWLAILAGLGLVLTFIYLAYEFIAQAAKPKHKIIPPAQPAWTLRDEPADPPDKPGASGK
jgi:hypothetical protein